MQIKIGRDRGLPIPVLRAFGYCSPITLIHVDAHLDWRDHVNGVREGLSRPIRPASEMDDIGEMFQISLRSSGSERPEEMRVALECETHLIFDIEL